MKCKIGDSVRFLNDVGGGTIVRFIGSNQVVVRNSDGFEIPVLQSEVVVVAADSSAKIEVTDEIVAAKSSLRQKKIGRLAEDNFEADEDNDDSPLALSVEPELMRDMNAYEILLGFYPQNQAKPTEGSIDLYLINDSAYNLLYTLGLAGNDGYIQHIKGGEVKADSKTFLKTLSLDDLAKVNLLNVSLMVYRSGRYPLHEPESIRLDVNPVKFFRMNAFTDNDYFDGTAMIYKLSSSQKTLADFIIPSAKEIEKAMKVKKDTLDGKLYKQKNQQEVEEVDLHIDALVDNAKELNNAEIMDIQLGRFITALDLGIRSGTKRMVFIHGVGNGKLKHELRRILDTQYAGKLRYQDASFKEYGYGATMVVM